MNFVPYLWKPALSYLLLVGVLAATSFASEAQEPQCRVCHEEVSVAGSVHEIFECVNCHSDLKEYPHPESVLGVESQTQLCAQCHSDVVEELGRGVHAELLECSGCHEPAHELRGIADLEGRMSPLSQVGVCGECHSEQGVLDRYLASVHGEALTKSGLITAPACNDCHGSHAIISPASPDSLVSTARVPETCAECHRYIFERWANVSAHGKLWARGEYGPVCTTCHLSHAVKKPDSPSERLKFPENCGGCHGDRYTTYRDSFHGQVTELGFLTAAVCSDCHPPHENLPAADPTSSVHPDRLASTCGKCHQGISEGFLTFDPHNEPSDPDDNPYVFAVWLVMTALLVIVFGLFVFHDLLWLQRSCVALIRREVSRVRDTSGPFIRRFENIDIGTHVAIVSSFLVLAATGLPLKFHDAAWAKWIAAAFGGIGMARTIHRVAAVVTFGYAFVHLGSLVHRVLVKRRYEILWGWKSMVPSLEDFRFLLQNMRYFVYQGPRPAADRWAYWEKFDYFAVFWGVIVIGLSGLVLWFPAGFTRVLPGWALNAAFVIHSDEALLAVGFIFVFHFFHTHLRPEVFPMDSTIFTGLVPLERFKEERPREYQRLVKSGQLESRLVDNTITPKKLRRVRIFGLIAVAVGTGLILLMLWAFVTHWS